MKNAEFGIRIEQTVFLHLENALVTKKFAKLEENMKIKMAIPNYICIVIERSLSLNVSF